MNKTLMKQNEAAKDGFTTELEAAVDNILNRLSDEELDRLLQGEDRTFLNQMTPAGEPLESSTSVQPEPSGVYVWGQFVLMTKFCFSEVTALDAHFVPNPEQAADRQDLALAA